ncbi:MAG: hypothetical protein ABSA75_11160 [Candidatus Bathyarchaeia archaeon]
MSKKGSKQLQVTNYSPQSPNDDSFEGKAKAQKELVEKLKVQWKLLWSECFNDKTRAEGVSVSDYTFLRVERGTIIHATRDFKALSFKEILEQHMVEDSNRFVQPDVNVGGWNKFVKTKITGRGPQRNKHAMSYVPNKREVQQPKKGGRGWLHAT